MYATIDNAEIDRLNRTGAVVAENKLQRDGFTATLQPNSTITGEVLDGDSGEPVAGAHVTLGLYGTYTDQRGRYSLERFDADKCHLSVAPPEGSTYLFTQADLTILPSEPARKHNFTLQRGSIITGQLREKETGAALRVPYVSIYYECEGPKRDVASARTKADGSYRMAVPAGKGKLFTYDSLPGCVPNDMVDDFTRNSVPVEIKPGETLAGKDLFFRRGMSVEGRVLDTDGKPVAGAVFQGVTEQLPSGVDGCFKLSGLAADEKSHFLIVHAQRRLGAKITIEPVRSGKPVALEVKLQPTHSGTVRVVDEKKRPLASVEVALIAHVRMRETDHGFGVLALPVYGPLRTDADGRIALPPLVADGSYSLEVSARGYAARTTRVRPQAGNALEVPDVVLLANDLTIAGVVLDATGEPVEGAQVSILPRNPDLAHTMHRSMNTPKDGRFHFSGLPKGTYRLIANLWKPTGETDAAGRPVNKSTASTQLLVEGGDETLRVVLRKQE
jgi:protocatechuate 3,4-dioxygenase beta subunit